MTAEQVAGLGPAFTSFLGSFRDCFPRRESFAHLGAYCRGLISDLARKSVEPIALAAGCAVRTLQEFLTGHVWDDGRMRDEIQRRVAREHLPAPGGRPADGIGTVGWVDETSTAKKGDKTPGVQRQYCGASGKIDNCIVTVHLACRCGDFMALLDSDLFLPEPSWDKDRDRCRRAHIPDHVIYTSKWLLALDQIKRALATGEVKYFVSNAPPKTALLTLMKVAFTRAGVEHVFRLAKTEVGFGHFEGRSYRGLMRHMTLCQLVLLFAAEQTDRPRGEKSAGDHRADRPRAQRPVPLLAGALLQAVPC